MISSEYLVVDASLIVASLVGSPATLVDGGLLRGRTLAAPELVGVEVLHVVRGLERGRQLTAAKARRAVQALERSAVELYPIRPLLAPSWALRHQLSLYDAMYVALAAQLGCAVATCDGRWQRAGDLGVPVLTLS